MEPLEFADEPFNIEEAKLITVAAQEMLSLTNGQEWDLRQEVDAIQASIDALDNWVEQVVTNGTPNDLSNLHTMAERLEENAFAMKKGHAEHSAKIVEEKK
eukprot:15366105-Ditylum_brightwellii.AAC.1